MAELSYGHECEIRQSIEAVSDKIEEVSTAFDDAKDAADIDDDFDFDSVALPAIVALHSLYTLVRELREAGATIAEAPVEEEALITCMANAQMIHRDMQADIAHMESVIDRIAPPAS